MEGEKKVPDGSADMQRIEAIIDGMTLMNDELFGKVFDHNIPATELLIRTILKRDDIRVLKVEGQAELRGPEVGGRDIRLDVLAEDSEGRRFDLEVQRLSSGAYPKRARFHSSMVDARMLKHGQEFKELKESYVIFITEEDYWKGGLPLYTIHRRIDELDFKLFDDESHILYVNGAYQSEDTLGRLMQDFRCTKSQDIQNAELARGMKHFKEGEGRKEMSDSLKEYAEELAKGYAEQQAIQALVETALQFGATKLQVIERIKTKYNYSEEEAERSYVQYAPVA